MHGWTRKAFLPSLYERDIVRGLKDVERISTARRDLRELKRVVSWPEYDDDEGQQRIRHTDDRDDVLPFQVGSKLLIGR